MGYLSLLLSVSWRFLGDILVSGTPALPRQLAWRHNANAKAKAKAKATKKSNPASAYFATQVVCYTPWSCPKNFEVLKNREDSSDFDDF